MEDLGLPRRVLAAGEEPRGDRVNVYQKVEIVSVLLGALKEEEVTFLRQSSLGVLLDFPSKPSWSGSFALFLLCRQSKIKKENGMWVLFAGQPVRFLLREFNLVTDLPCGCYPPTTEKRKRKGSSNSRSSYYHTLFGTENDVTIDRVLCMLKEDLLTDSQVRLRLACLVLVDGILLPTTQYPRCKIVKEHVEMVDDLQAFLAYPWGRLSFDRIMSTVQERDITSTATGNIAIQGLFQNLQMVVIEAVPELQLQSEHKSGEGVDDSNLMAGVIVRKKKLCPFNVKHTKKWIYIARYFHVKLSIIKTSENTW